MKDEKEKERAQRRAEVIMQVRTGQMTATDAATALGISRKTYYEWEKKGLGAMLEALENGPSGRPAEAPDSEKESLREELKDAKTRLLLSEKALEVQEILEGFPELKELGGKEQKTKKRDKKKGKKKKRGKSSWR